MSFSDDLEILLAVDQCYHYANYVHHTQKKSIVLTAECCYETGTFHYFNQLTS
jgi:hypothetical protein